MKGLSFMVTLWSFQYEQSARAVGMLEAGVNQAVVAREFGVRPRNSSGILNIYPCHLHATVWSWLSKMCCQR